MAMTGGIGYEIDQLTELGVPELMRRQGVDPQLKYALALQQATKMVEAAARERDMSQPMPAPANVVGQMETSLAKRLAPGVQMQGQRSQRMQNRAAMGLPGQAAPNLARMAQGGIVGYAEGGDVQQQDPMQAQLERFMQLQKLYETRQAAGATEEELTRIQEDIDSYSRVNSPGYNIEVEAGKARGEYDTPNGMAMGGIVGYEKGGPVDMDALLDALMIAESGGDPKAVSRAGAEGAYQIMPSTAADPGFGVSPMEGDRFDPEASRAFARQYLQAMLDRYDGDVEAALIAYNAGAGNADKFMAANRDYDVLPQTMQTKPYVSKIMGQVEQEDRRRDFQMGGGRTISTTAPESYTERQRRETKERADRALASRFATVPEETKSELYEPNIPDALAVAKAQTDLMGGPTMNMGERDPRFTEEAQSNRSAFAQAFPKAEKAVADYAEDKKLGGLGALRTMGRLQESRRNAFSEAFPKAAQAAADYATDKEMGGIGALRVAGRLQEQREANEKAEANRALNYLKQQAEMQQLLEAVDPAAQDVKGFDEGGDVEGQGFLGNLQQTVYDATKGFMPDPGELIGGQLDAAEEDPLNYAANATLALYGGPALIRGGATLLGPVIKKFGTKYGPAVLQRARDLALRATTKPNPAATPRVGNAPGQIKKGVVQPTQGTQIPKGQPGAGRMQAGPPGRVVDPLRIGAGVALGVKAADALLGGEEIEETEEAAALTEADIFRRDAPAGLVSAIDRNEGEQAALRDMFPDAPEMTAQQRVEERARIARGGGDRRAPRGTGLAGLLGRIDMDKVAKVAETLGRGAGASKGFEAAQIVQESAKARQVAQARQDQIDALEKQLDVKREQISATKATAEAAAGAKLSQAQAKMVADYMGGVQFSLDVKALAERQGKSPDDPSVARAVLRTFLSRVQGSVGGMSGLETQQGLPEAASEAAAYLAETS